MKPLIFAVTLMLGLVATPTAFAQAFVSVQVTPPPLPVYAQPPCPAPGYLWTPGYWAWSPADNGYFWVPGTWVLPPQPDYLWTPGYWAWNGTFFVWRPGYWGPTVGFYGGIDYGYGYTGAGYHGGYWRDRHFYYNREVNNINVRAFHYNYRRAVAHRSVNHVSYNGGRGGRSARPGSEYGRRQARRINATHSQLQQRDLARRNRGQFDKVNHGRPGVTATARPGAFQQHGSAHGGISRSARPAARSSNRQAARPQRQTAPRQAQPHRQPGAAPHRTQQRAVPTRRASPQRQPQRRAEPAQHHRAEHEQRDRH